jgi:hypothetical protein
MRVVSDLELVNRTAVLGVRFWDNVTGRAVGEGLHVTESTTGRRAVRGPSNVYVFGDLPGLRAASFGIAEPTFWNSPPATAGFTFEVTDRDRRFIPFRFSAELPQRSLFVPSCVATSSPPGVGNSVPLFSAPARPTQPGFASVRADLWDALADAPAAGAVLEISGVGADTWSGVSDTRGSVVVQCPYPEPRWQDASPPPGSSALSQQGWTIGVSVRYSPAIASPPASGGPAIVGYADRSPDLCAILTQTAGTLLAGDSPSADLPPQTLLFGSELILRSAGQSVLLVLPT